MHMYYNKLTFTLKKSFILGFSWTDLKNLQRSAQCVIYYGQIHWKTLEMRKPQNTLLIIALEVAHISTGNALFYILVAKPEYHNH